MKRRKSQAICSAEEEAQAWRRVIPDLTRQITTCMAAYATVCTLLFIYLTFYPFAVFRSAMALSLATEANLHTPAEVANLAILVSTLHEALLLTTLILLLLGGVFAAILVPVATKLASHSFRRVGRLLFPFSQRAYRKSRRLARVLRIRSRLALTAMLAAALCLSVSPAVFSTGAYDGRAVGSAASMMMLACMLLFTVVASFRLAAILRNHPKARRTRAALVSKDALRLRFLGWCSAFVVTGLLLLALIPAARFLMNSLPAACLTHLMPMEEFSLRWDLAADAIHFIEPRLAMKLPSPEHIHKSLDALEASGRGVLDFLPYCKRVVVGIFGLLGFYVFIFPILYVRHETHGLGRLLRRVAMLFVTSILLAKTATWFIGYAFGVDIDDLLSVGIVIVVLTLFTNAVD